MVRVADTMESSRSATVVPGHELAEVTRVVFRDPTGHEEEAAALKVNIARALVRAPTLPVTLGSSPLRLVDVQVDRRGVDLVLGLESPIAALRVEPSSRPDGEGVVRLAARKPSPVQVQVREVHPTLARFRAQVDAMAARVRDSVTDARWAEAWAQARALRVSPAGVPLGFFRQIVAGLAHPEGLIRTGFLCNQDCGLCWQDRAWGRFDAEQVLRWIEDLYAAGARSLIISGGEPTLDPALDRYLSHARSVGFTSVTLETNAIQCAKPGVAERLRDAGLTSAFVSLHSADPSVSDAITRAPGTHVRTVRGVKALLAAGVPVKFNAVMTLEGLDHLAALPGYIVAEFGGPHDGVLGLMLSYPTEPYDLSLAPAIVPEPAKLRRVLRETLDGAFALGLKPQGLDGPCGPPLCAFGADPRVTSLRPVPGPVEFRRHLPPCDGCSARPACFGVRLADVELYGESCVSPLP